MMGNPAEAAVALDRAQYVYPFDMDIHRRLGDLYRGLGDWKRVIRERQAVLALAYKLGVNYLMYAMLH